MNHVLKAAPLSRSENIATYYDPELPLADGLMEPIAGCIERVSRLGEGKRSVGPWSRTVECIIHY